MSKRKKDDIKPLLLLIIIPAMLYAIVTNWNDIKSYLAAKQCGCDNVDDCLSKYKFEEARKFASSINTSDDSYNYGNGRWSKEALFDVIYSETKYWISQNELIRAENTAKELSNFSCSDETILRDIDDEVKTKYVELINEIIIKYCESGNFEKANNKIIELPEKIIYKRINSFTESELNDKKNKLQLDQGIEKSWSGSYNIVQYSYPKKESLKIIEQYKNKIK